MNLSVRHLEKIRETDKLPTVIKATVKILLVAINDWPNPIVNLVDYENEVYKLIGEDADRKKMENYISRVDYSKHAWEAESLNQLIEIYNYYEETKSLKKY